MMGARSHLAVEPHLSLDSIDRRGCAAAQQLRTGPRPALRPEAVAGVAHAGSFLRFDFSDELPHGRKNGIFYVAPSTHPFESRHTKDSTSILA